MSDQQNQDLDPFFYIPNEEGVEEKFEILYEFDVDDTGYHYILLTPAIEEEEEAVEEIEVYPIKFKIGDEEPVFEIIETDEEWDMIEEVLHTLEEEDL